MSRAHRSQTDTNKVDKWKNRMAKEIMCKVIMLTGFKVTLISKVIWMLSWTV